VHVLLSLVLLACVGEETASAPTTWESIPKAERIAAVNALATAQYAMAINPSALEKAYRGEKLDTGVPVAVWGNSTPSGRGLGSFASPSR
jgi:hypothetical protein